MSHINNPSSSIDSNEAALLTSLEGLASGTGQAIVKSGSTTLGLVTFGDLTKSQADTYYYPAASIGNPAGYVTGTPWTGLGYITLASLSAGTGISYDNTTGVITNIAPYTTPLTTKGDILGYDTAPNKIPVGSDNQVLTADSTQALGVKDRKSVV